MQHTFHSHGFVGAAHASHSLPLQTFPSHMIWTTEMEPMFWQAIELLQTISRDGQTSHGELVRRLQQQLEQDSASIEAWLCLGFLGGGEVSDQVFSPTECLDRYKVLLREVAEPLPERVPCRIPAMHKKFCSGYRLRGRSQTKVPVCCEGSCDASGCSAPYKVSDQGAHRSGFPSDMPGACDAPERARATVWEWCLNPEKELQGALADEDWGSYSVELNKSIEEAYNGGVAMHKVDIGVAGYNVVFDTTFFGRMVQINPKLSTIRTIRRRSVSICEAPVKGQRQRYGAEEICALCVESFDDNTTLPVTDLPCAHRFHSVCVAQIAAENRPCPVCRTKIYWPHVLQGVSYSSSSSFPTPSS